MAKLLDMCSQQFDGKAARHVLTATRSGCNATLTCQEERTIINSALLRLISQRGHYGFAAGVFEYLNWTSTLGQAFEREDLYKEPKSLTSSCIHSARAAGPPYLSISSRYPCASALNVYCPSGKYPIQLHNGSTAKCILPTSLRFASPC
jgi:hypothetical protein